MRSSEPSSPSRFASPAGARVPTLASVAALLWLAACTTPAPPPPPPPPPPKPMVMEVHCAPPMEEQDSAARHFFATQDRLSTLNTADVANEANHPADASVQGQLDQALALSLTHVPGDTQRAQALVDQITHNTSRDADPWRGPARLLATMLAEQRRLQDQADHTTQQLRDAQRDSQRKLDQVNEKLDQLKAIEHSLNARPGSAAASKPVP